MCVLPVALGGCLDIARMTYHFDLSAGTGTLELYDIGTDDPNAATKDFGELVNDYVLGTKVMEDHPTWQVGDRHLEERDGVLVGVVQFQFHSAADVGLYQHDKKSMLLWCAKDEETVIATSGTIIPQYPRCVAFDRKSRSLDVTVKTSTALGDARSLLPNFKAWDGNVVPVADDGSNAALGGMFGQAFGQALGQQGGAGFDLSSALPETAVTAEWAKLGLPIEGGRVLVATDRMLEVTHSSADAPGLLTSYGAALEKAGWKTTGTEGGSTSYAKDDATLRLSTVAAGPATIVMISK
jgi:hypothetical protein